MFTIHVMPYMFIFHVLLSYMDLYVLNILMSTYVVTLIFVLHASIVAHTQDSYFGFHSYMVRTHRLLWTLLIVTPWVLLSIIKS